MFSSDILVSVIKAASYWRYVKVTPDLRGCPPGKNSYTRHFRHKQGKLYIVEKAMNADFGKKYKLPVSAKSQKP